MENIALIRVVQDHYVGHSKVFLDRQGHLGEVLCHLEAFGTIRNAREASGAQRCEFDEIRNSENLIMFDPLRV